jgi:hypothetical protein
MFSLGITEIMQRRFETFMQADEYDSLQVSRWTWLPGAG